MNGKRPSFGSVQCAARRGVLGGRHVGFIRYYADQAIRLIEDPRNHAGWSWSCTCMSTTMRSNSTISSLARSFTVTGPSHRIAMSSFGICSTHG